MRQQDFDNLFFSSEFDVLSVFDARVLRVQVESLLSTKADICDAKLTNRVSSVFRKERGDSKVCKKELKLFDDLSRKFIDVFQPFFVEKFSRTPNLDEVLTASKKAFSKFMPYRYVESVVSAHRLRSLLKNWGYAESKIDFKIGRKSYEIALTISEIETAVDESLNNYFVGKGYIQSEQKKSEIDVLKSLMQKLESSEILSKSDKVSLCCEFFDHLITKNRSELLVLTKEDVKSIAERWVIEPK
jgi:hypothetical protein